MKVDKMEKECECVAVKIRPGVHKYAVSCCSQEHIDSGLVEKISHFSQDNLCVQRVTNS